MEGHSAGGRVAAGRRGLIGFPAGAGRAGARNKHQGQKCAPKGSKFRYTLAQSSVAPNVYSYALNKWLTIATTDRMIG